MGTKRGASWAAVSSLPQAKKISLQDQLALNRDHAGRHGVDIVEELVVPGESRNIVLFEDAARKMPAYARLRELIDSKAIDVLFYLDRSRLGRKGALSMAVVGLCHEAGIAVYEIENPPSSLDAARQQSHDEMLLGAIKSVGAEREVRKLMERHRSGMIGRIKAGRPASKLVYGYRPFYDDNGNRTILIDEPAAAVVRRIFATYLDGHGTPYIARSLNADDIPAPMGGEWAAINVRSILDNVRRYAGVTAVNRRSRTGRPYTEAPASWESIIDQATLERIEAERKYRRDSRRIVDTPYLLSGIVYCMHCQRRMVVQSLKPKSDTAVGARQLICHTHGGIAYRRVDATLREKMASLNDVDLDSLAITIDPLDALRNQLAIYAVQLADLEAAITRAENAYIRGRLPLERYEVQVDGLNAEIAGVRKQQQQVEQELTDAAARGNQRQRLEETATLGLAKLDDPDTASSNAWLRTHVRIWIDGKSVFAVEWI